MIYFCMCNFVCCFVLFFFFFFKQKTAYEMRISDWSSDVCSSDLGQRIQLNAVRMLRRPFSCDGEGGNLGHKKFLGDAKQTVCRDLKRLGHRVKPAKPLQYKRCPRPLPSAPHPSSDIVHVAVFIALPISAATSIQSFAVVHSVNALTNTPIFPLIP